MADNPFLRDWRAYCQAMADQTGDSWYADRVAGLPILPAHRWVRAIIKKKGKRAKRWKGRLCYARCDASGQPMYDKNGHPVEDKEWLDWRTCKPDLGH